MRKTFLILLIILLSFNIVHAEDSFGKDTKGVYTDTTNAVFDVLNGKDFKSNPVYPGGYTSKGNDGGDSLVEEPYKDANKDEVDNSGPNYGPPSKSYIVPGIIEQKGTILERLQKDSNFSMGDAAKKADEIGTAFHSIITQWVIGLSPIFLIIGVGLVLFSSKKAAGFLLMFGVGLFVVIFAPELVKVFINAITGIFY